MIGTLTQTCRARVAAVAREGPPTRQGARLTRAPRAVLTEPLSKGPDRAKPTSGAVLLADSRARARSVDRVLRADVELDPELRRQLARLADRVAVDLARLERVVSS